MHFIKTFKFISIKLDAVFSLTLFYLLCSYGYVPRSIPICLFVFSLSLSLSFEQAFAFYWWGYFYSFLFHLFHFICFNSFLVLSLTLFYNSCLFFFFFWLLELKASFVYFWFFLLLKAVELLTTILPMYCTSLICGLLAHF